MFGGHGFATLIGLCRRHTGLH